MADAWMQPDPADRLLADSEALGQAQRDQAAGRVYQVVVTVMGPTPADAERWAGSIADMVIGEFGDSMRLQIDVRPAGASGASAETGQTKPALPRAEIDRLIAASSLGTPGVQAVIAVGSGEPVSDEVRRLADEEIARVSAELDAMAEPHICSGCRTVPCPTCPYPPEETAP